MARVTLRDGRELDVADSDTALLGYYREEGATIEEVAASSQFPVVIVNGEVVQPPVEVAPGEFDRTEHNVDEVNEYLETADPAEAQRVLLVEESGKKRVGILGDWSSST